ncbi:MAG: hypothetical protein ACR2HN_12420 [Tepidiformaceae bacterium]
MDPPARLMQALTAAAAAPPLRALDEERQLTLLIPELEAGRGFQQPELHYYDVLDHNLAAVAALDAALGAGADGQELRTSLA